AGFFAKFYVFLAAIKAGLFTLAVIGVLSSVVGAYYYLAIVKIMYFDEPAKGFEPMPTLLRLVLGGFRPHQHPVFCLPGAAPWCGYRCGKILVLNEPRGHGPGGGPAHSLRDARLDQRRGAVAHARRRARTVVDHSKNPDCRPRSSRQPMGVAAGQS